MFISDSDNLSLEAAIDKIKSIVPGDLCCPKAAIVCGSGLGTLGSALVDRVDVAYAEIPGFLSTKVLGHQSTLAFGFIGTGLSRVPVVAMLGRFHVYEGHSPREVTFPVRLFARLGCRNIILTNAAGSLNPRIPVGAIVAIHDHISLPSMSALSPLYGSGSTSTNSPRFLPLSDAYSRTLRRHLFHASIQLKLPPDTLAEGTYCWVTGPTYETAAEGRWLREAGGDVVGASTVPEVIVARDEGMNVLVLSLVTNAVVIPPSEKQSVRKEAERELAGLDREDDVTETVVSHDEVIAMGAQKAELVKKLVVSVVQMLA